MQQRHSLPTIDRRQFIGATAAALLFPRDSLTSAANIPAGALYVLDESPGKKTLLPLVMNNAGTPQDFVRQAEVAYITRRAAAREISEERANQLIEQYDPDGLGFSFYGRVCAVFENGGNYNSSMLLSKQQREQQKLSNLMTGITLGSMAVGTAVAPGIGTTTFGVISYGTTQIPIALQNSRHAIERQREEARFRSTCSQLYDYRIIENYFPELDTLWNNATRGPGGKLVNDDQINKAVSDAYPGVPKDVLGLAEKVQNGESLTKSEEQRVTDYLNESTDGVFLNNIERPLDFLDTEQSLTNIITESAPSDEPFWDSQADFQKDVQTVRDVAVIGSFFADKLLGNPKLAGKINAVGDLATQAMTMAFNYGTGNYVGMVAGGLSMLSSASSLLGDGSQGPSLGEYISAEFDRVNGKLDHIIETMHAGFTASLQNQQLILDEIGDFRQETRLSLQAIQEGVGELVKNDRYRMQERYLTAPRELGEELEGHREKMGVIVRHIRKSSTPENLVFNFEMQSIDLLRDPLDMTNNVDGFKLTSTVADFEHVYGLLGGIDQTVQLSEQEGGSVVTSSFSPLWSTGIIPGVVKKAKQIIKDQGSIDSSEKNLDDLIAKYEGTNEQLGRGDLVTVVAWDYLINQAKVSDIKINGERLLFSDKSVGELKERLTANRDALRDLNDLELFDVLVQGYLAERDKLVEHIRDIYRTHTERMHPKMAKSGKNYIADLTEMYPGGFPSISTERLPPQGPRKGLNNKGFSDDKLEGIHPNIVAHAKSARNVPSNTYLAEGGIMTVGGLNNGNPVPGYGPFFNVKGGKIIEKARAMGVLEDPLHARSEHGNRSDLRWFAEWTPGVQTGTSQFWPAHKLITKKIKITNDPRTSGPLPVYTTTSIYGPFARGGASLDDNNTLSDDKLIADNIFSIDASIERPLNEGENRYGISSMEQFIDLLAKRMHDKHAEVRSQFFDELPNRLIGQNDSGFDMKNYTTLTHMLKTMTAIAQWRVDGGDTTATRLWFDPRVLSENQNEIASSLEKSLPLVTEGENKGKVERKVMTKDNELVDTHIAIEDAKTLDEHIINELVNLTDRQLVSMRATIESTTISDVKYDIVPGSNKASAVIEQKPLAVPELDEVLAHVEIMHKASKA